GSGVGGGAVRGGGGGGGGARRERVGAGGHRGSPTRGRGARRAPERGDRGSAYGRHERGRRPVRRRQDVPAAGREVGPGDETGGGAPGALHRGAEGGIGRRSVRAPQGRDRDGQRGCARR